MKICQDGRIWGQNNKQAGDHLGIAIENKPKGHNPNSTGYPFKKGNIPWNKGKSFMTLEKHWNWKGGISKDPNYSRSQFKKKRKEHPEIIKQYKRIYYWRKRGGGKLSIKIIQLVYENNIKQFGTLTCVYCVNPIEFGQDTVDHKIPLSRGGTNEYNNLTIACKICNSRKHDKTPEEFLEYKILKGGGKEVMSEKKIPAIKPVGKPDGIPKGNGYQTISTPGFEHPNGNELWSDGQSGGKILNKPYGK